MPLTLSRTRRIDWPRVVANLRGKGMSFEDIARGVDVTKQAVMTWADEGGSGDPTFWAGSVLIELWCARTGLRWTDLPMREVAPSVSAVLRQYR